MKLFKLSIFTFIISFNIYSSDRFNYNKADSRDIRIGQKIDDVFGTDNIRIWFYDSKKLLNSAHMFQDERNDYYQLRIKALNKLKSTNIDIKLLDLKQSKKIFGKGREKLVISDDDREKILQSGCKYLFLFHDFFWEEDTSGLPAAYKGAAIAVAAITGGGIGALLSLANSDNQYVYITGITLSVYDLEKKERMIFLQTMLPAYTYIDDNYNNVIKRIFDSLFSELQSEKYKKTKERKKNKVIQKEKTNTNLFENPRDRRRQVSED